ncbi:hypothetical protein C2845_PM10G02390 [Panicum miliaceum]|uniref:KIB1-4 beta-propeller domain-containing protein n=1 Tax=Panicum miliaceum TaxID=4540 RepID=A0A3L6PCY1_PANMI|nr:hypothetical protein C2845_PM10G02390 [Panicum miliaceum]
MENGIGVFLWNFRDSKLVVLLSLAVSMMKKEARSSVRPDLQPELLGLVLLRLPSLADRVRLRAVCRPWRSSAQLQALPSPLPWLTLLNGTFLSIPDGEIIRMPAPDDAFFCGSIDSWLFFVHSDGGCSLVNPFSKATLDLPKLPIQWFEASPRIGSSFQKLVVPSPLESSPGSLVAALILDNGGTISMCRPPIATYLPIWRNRGWNCVSDTTFFKEKFYGLGIDDVLMTFELNYGADSKPRISRVKCITKYPTRRVILPRTLSSGKSYMEKKYLVECCGRLLMVKRLIEFTDATREHPLDCDRTARHLRSLRQI